METVQSLRIGDDLDPDDRPVLDGEAQHEFAHRVGCDVTLYGAQTGFGAVLLANTGARALAVAVLPSAWFFTRRRAPVGRAPSGGSRRSP